MRILLADDREEDVALLSAMLSGVKGVDVVGTVSRLSELEGALRRCLPEVLFLDIRFPERSGLEVVEQVRASGCEVVLVTAFDEYALEAFRLRVRDYLLKPVRKQRLLETLQWLREVVTKEPAGWDGEFSLPVGGVWRRISVAAVEWMETQGNYTMVYLDDGVELSCRMPLYRIFQRLPAGHDMRQLTRNLAVPLRRVEAMVGIEHGCLQLALDNGQILRSSRRRTAALRKELENLFGMNS